MVHSSAMRCTRGGQPVPIAWPEDATADCMHVEYGNPFDPMGGGGCNHMNGVQKAYQDWLGGCNVIKATSSGTFTIRPLASACDGPQLLHIPFPAPRKLAANVTLTGYYLELRAPIGYRDQALQPQVLVIVANDVREARQAGNNNWLLDMNPQTATPRDSALPVGQKYEDVLPGGPKFTVLSADAEQAVIQVELGGQPAEAGKLGQAICSDLKPYDPNAMVKCVAPATPAAPPPADGGAPDGGGGMMMPMGGSGGAGSGGAGGASGGAGGGAGAGNQPGGGGGSGAGGSTGGGTPSPGGTADAGRPRPGTNPPTTPSQGSTSSGGCQVVPGGGGGGVALVMFAALLALGRRSRRRHPS
jgi:MYXO-CTERM domain-containing protein